MKSIDSGLPRCEHCGGTIFTFREIVGPEETRAEHQRHHERLADLEREAQAMRESVQLRKTEAAREAEQCYAEFSRRRDQLQNSLPELTQELAKLYEIKENSLAPLRERARKAAEAAFKAKAESDPTVYLYGGETDEREVHAFFEPLYAAATTHPQFSQLLDRIRDVEARKAAIDAQLVVITADLDGERLNREKVIASFDKDGNDQRAALKATAQGLRRDIESIERKSRATVVFCVTCGTTVTAVADPRVFSDRMDALEAVLARHVSQSERLVAQLTSISSLLSQMKKDSEEGKRAIKDAIHVLGNQFENAVCASNSQLVKALAGSFAEIQVSMSKLVARANQETQREQAEALRENLGRLLGG